MAKANQRSPITRSAYAICSPLNGMRFSVHIGWIVRNLSDAQLVQLAAGSATLMALQLIASFSLRGALMAAGLDLARLGDRIDSTFCRNKKGLLSAIAAAH